MIISHHGHYEFGSPKLPMFPEALMLHYLDDLDSKMESMRAQLERDAAREGDWTGYNASLERPLLDSRKVMGRAMAANSTSAQPFADEKPAAAAAGEESLSTTG